MLRLFCVNSFYFDFDRAEVGARLQLEHALHVLEQFEELCPFGQIRVVPLDEFGEHIVRENRLESG